MSAGSMAIQEIIDNLNIQLELFYKEESKIEVPYFWMNVIKKSIMIELIKRSYDSTELKTSLRNHRGIDSDDVRMRDSRIMSYAQHYRNLQYSNLVKEHQHDEPDLLSKEMDSINNKLSGYKLNKMQYKELQSLADCRLFKMITSKRICDVKKVSKDEFVAAMKEYDELLRSLIAMEGNNDDDTLFAVLQLYTLEWKYNVELFYRTAIEAEKNSTADVPVDEIAMLCGDITIRHPLNPNSIAMTESRMIPFRNDVVKLAYDDERKEELRERINQYLSFKIFELAIPVEGETLIDEFLSKTTKHEWAEYIRNNYFISSMYEEKEWTLSRIRYVRKLYRKLYRDLPTPKSK